MFSFIRAHSSAVEPPAHNGLILGSNPSGPTIIEVRNAMFETVEETMQRESKFCSIGYRTTNHEQRIMNIALRAISSAVERILHTDEVTGSRPVSPTSDTTGFSLWRLMKIYLYSYAYSYAFTISIIDAIVSSLLGILFLFSKAHSSYWQLQFSSLDERESRCCLWWLYPRVPEGPRQP